MPHDVRRPAYAGAGVANAAAANYADTHAEAACADAGRADPAPQTAAATARPGSLALTVTSEKGVLLSDAIVGVHGAVDRGGTTGVDGVVTLQNLPAGTYRCRVTRDGFVMLDKEVTIRAGARTAAEGVLWAAPTPSPSPTPTPSPSPQATPASAPAGPVGTPRALSIAELGDQMLRDSQPTTERPIGCSGVTSTKLIATRENIALHRNPNADEVLYLLAGDATLTLAGNDQSVSAGWVSLVPRRNRLFADPPGPEPGRAALGAVRPAVRRREVSN